MVTRYTFFNPFTLNCWGFSTIQLTDPLYPCMIYHLKAIDMCIPNSASTTTKEVIALTNDGLKEENEKVQKSQNRCKY